jgi:metabolite-proton symporter
MAEADRGRSTLAMVLRVTSGNFLEMFDFFLFGFYATDIAHAFFPTGSQFASLMLTFATFGAGFLMRPLGAVLLGAYIDRIGRRRGLIVTLLLMAVGTVLIACTPGYATIGLFAPLLVLAGRLLQGFSAGVELGGVSVYLAEMARPGRKGFLVAWQSGSQQVAIMLAAALGFALSRMLDAPAIAAWGWRVPFFIGAGAAVIAFYLRRSLAESASAETRSRKEAGSMSALFRNHTPAFLTVLGYTAGGSLIFYTFTTYMQKYLVNTAHMPKETVNIVMTAVLFTYMIMQPPFGALSDRIGRKTSMMIFGGLATLCTVPLMYAIGGVTSPFAAYLLVVAALAIVSFYTSVAGIVKAEMFPAEVRALGVGLSYAVANALFGGTAEAVALTFKTEGHETWFYWYVTGMCALAFVTAAFALQHRPTYLQGEETE